MFAINRQNTGEFILQSLVSNEKMKNLNILFLIRFPLC